MVRLTPMNNGEADSWLSTSVVEYANGLMKTRDMSKDEATPLAEETLQKLLPNREATPGHIFSWITDSEARIGRLWYGPSPTDDMALYIYDISIDEGAQGRGFGGEVLDLVAELATDKGLSAVELNVFGDNAGARRLYERKGFVAVHEHKGQIGMRLDISQRQKGGHPSV